MVARNIRLEGIWHAMSLTRDMTAAFVNM